MLRFSSTVNLIANRNFYAKYVFVFSVTPTEMKYMKFALNIYASVFYTP